MHGAEQPGLVWRGGLDRRVILGAGHVEIAPHRKLHQVRTFPRRIWPCLAERRDRCEDHAGVFGAQPFVAEAQPFHLARGERLEHHISEAFEARIAEWLGHPSHAPHGDPIPTVELELPQDAPTKCLAALVAGERGLVARVLTQDHDTLNLLAHLHLRPGTAVRVLEHSPQGIRIALRHEQLDERFLLPPSLAQVVWVKVSGNGF
ncbi:MAG: metal-dependent transcriptional regulator [Bryobacteraceae bacterium]|nr:metal-dependent transcriptional regulator [Bryobacteraceae bacterium]